MKLELLFVREEKEEQKEEKFYYTVKEIAQNVKGLLERKFPYLWIEGELSGIKQSQNGNLYLNLVEEETTLKGIIFKDQKGEIPPEVLQNGLKVLAFGKLTFFGRSGEVFFIIRKIEPLGLGLLHLKREFLLKKYKNLFAPELKRDIPPFPRKIGIITSLFGAALQDFLKISLERWEAHILIYPVRIQGEGAELEISEALKDLNENFSDLDLIVITRGGGSLEDLMPFYTEEIILAVRNSRIPVVSAVGHEIDYTLCDLAADKRCPTPSAAAQEIFPDKNELLSRLELYRKKIYQLVSLKINAKEAKLKNLQLLLQEKSPLNQLQRKEAKIKELKFKLFQQINSLLLKQEQRLNHFKKNLEVRSPLKLLEVKEETLKGLKKLLFSLSPYNILKRGYSIVKSYPEGRVIRSVKDLKGEELLEIIFSKGKALVKVIEIKEEERR